MKKGSNKHKLWMAERTTRQQKKGKYKGRQSELSQGTEIRSINVPLKITKCKEQNVVKEGREYKDQERMEERKKMEKEREKKNNKKENEDED